MKNPIKSITKKEWGILICSILVIGISNLVTGNVNMLMLLAAWIGVNSLVLAAKGNVWAQILMVVFSILYAVISWTFRYWGEMITYLGMTLPMAVCSTITWLKNPSENGKDLVLIVLWILASFESPDYMRALKNSHFFAGAFSFQHINSTYIQKCSKTYKKMPLY